MIRVFRAAVYTLSYYLLIMLCMILLNIYSVIIFGYVRLDIRLRIIGNKKT